MEARENFWKDREDLKDYTSQINWDRMFFKAQMILGGILLAGILVYLMWAE